MHAVMICAHTIFARRDLSSELDRTLARFIGCGHGVIAVGSGGEDDQLDLGMQCNACSR